MYGNIIIGGGASLITGKLYRLRPLLTIAYPESSRFLYMPFLRPAHCLQNTCKHKKADKDQK
ncbi:hypothetical protein CLOSTHATH_00147 [Hungatella hathewayi DSM 13479]|uniref:Uncharacterized protein n=1 Tax=Hungatella hathewayi DSM 13479 TaxID=566550 RepID=D3A977_9FIRM|nr:hypothetical protein CLOSTHATH_00147 [Hungatella hathewayi DSM 13479]